MSSPNTIPQERRNLQAHDHRNTVSQVSEVASVVASILLRIGASDTPLHKIPIGDIHLTHLTHVEDGMKYVAVGGETFSREVIEVVGTKVQVWCSESFLSEKCSFHKRMEEGRRKQQFHDIPRKVNLNSEKDVISAAMQANLALRGLNFDALDLKCGHSP
ncbi:dna rna helicase [Fusarium beomiforme]|uniref:Dna rna helicase n=1 Tax=Fusarium beomiforme TaxID=44412 RepID=A0A9P5DSX5_9HYPO|nr:dna rna helicase [Fusarium beomiforme]